MRQIGRPRDMSTIEEPRFQMKKVENLKKDYSAKDP
jgi:hypothetical protein